MTRARTRQDSVDRHVALWQRELPWMDPLHEQVVARLMLLTKHLARAREAALADDELGRASFKVLLALRRLGPPYTAQPSELAEQLGLSRGALSARLSPLEDDGLITRTTDPDDRRRVHVELTAAGREAFDRHGQHEGRDEAALLDVLSKADQRRLADLLRTLVLAVEETVGVMDDTDSSATPSGETRSNPQTNRCAQPRVEVRATSSGSRTTCSCAWSGLPASSRTSSAARRPSSWRGCRTEVRGTAAAPAK